MGRDQIISVVASVLVIVLVSVLQERSRFLAAVLTSMPLMVPLALWVVYSGSGGDHAKTAEFAAALVPGVLGTLAFVVGAWLALRWRLGLGWALGSGALAWLVVIAAGRALQLAAGR